MYLKDLKSQKKIHYNFNTNKSKCFETWFKLNTCVSIYSTHIRLANLIYGNYYEFLITLFVKLYRLTTVM